MKNKMKNTIAIISAYLSCEFTSRKTIVSGECEIAQNLFKRKTNCTGFLVSAVLFLFLSLFSASGEARAAPYTVNLDTDVGDAKEADGICDTNLAMPGEQCTLRAALTESNYIAGIDSISFSLPLPSVISLSGSYGALTIYDSVSINGPGARIDHRAQQRRGIWQLPHFPDFRFKYRRQHQRRYHHKRKFY